MANRTFGLAFAVATIAWVFCLAVTSSAQPGAAGQIQRYQLGTVFYAFVIIPDGYQLKVRTPTPFVLTDLATNLRCTGFAITGAYAGANGAVEGLVVDEGRILSQQSGRSDGGFVAFDGTSVAISRVPDRPSWSGGRPISVVQSHPILIMNGSIDLPLNDPQPANRVSMGKLEDGRLFMAMAYNSDRQGLSAVTLLQFAQGVDQLLDGRVDWLMNFDGGPSAFLVAGRTAVAPSPGRVASYLCAEPAG